jgi:hypothetical protein
MEKQTLTVEIIPQDIPDFYLMVRDFTKHRGNTFAILFQQLKNEYPEIARGYGDTPED